MASTMEMFGSFQDFAVSFIILALDAQDEAKAPTDVCVPAERARTRRLTPIIVMNARSVVTARLVYFSI